MARSSQVSVGSVKALLVDKTKAGGPIVRVSNPATAAATIFVGGDENELGAYGGSALTSTTGYAIPVGGAETFILQGQEALYAITATVTLTVHVFRSGG